MTPLEDRLRNELREEADQITPDGIADLKLRSSAGRRLDRGRGRRAGHWQSWAKPLAAAAAVAAAVGGTFAAVHAIGRPPAAAAHAAPVTTTIPAYYAYTVQGNLINRKVGRTRVISGVQGRHVAIRATATGKTLAIISPPKPYTDFTLLTGAADGRVFVLGAEWTRNIGPTSVPALAEHDEVTPLKFLVARVTPTGQVRISSLSLRQSPYLEEHPSIALSPDGTRLAVAYRHPGRPAVVEVVTLATGAVQRWVTSNGSWTPSLQDMGAWAANGQTLAVTEVGTGHRRGGPMYRPPHTTRTLLLGTAASGTSLTSATLLVLHPPAGQIAPRELYLTADGQLLLSPVTSSNNLWLPRGRVTGELAVYSARTGALLRTVGRWVWRYPSPPGRGGEPDQILAWSDPSGAQFVVLQPGGDLNTLAVLAGGSAPANDKLLPQQSGAATALQDVLRSASRMVW